MSQIVSDRLSMLDLNDPASVGRIEAFLATQGGTPFHQPRWLKAIERGTGQEALGLVVERGDCIVGWLPLSIVHSPIFGRALVSSAFAVGGGPLAVDRLAAQTLCHGAEELAIRRSASGVELRGGLAPSGWVANNASHCNFRRELAADDEAQLLSIPRKARAEVRKGLDQDFEIAVGSQESDRCAHYACYAESVRNLGTPVFPRRLFEAVLDEFSDDADILTVRHRGVAVASVLSLYANGAVMPYWGGGTFAARALRANERMYYELMLHARRRGCSHFDFGRSKTGSGPYFFKKNWGFEPEPLTYWVWNAPGVAARNIDPTDTGYSAKIALWKRLPLKLANSLGPYLARGLG